MILNQDTIARPELHEQVSPVSLFKAAVLQSDIGGPPTDTHTHTFQTNQATGYTLHDLTLTLYSASL